MPATRDVSSSTRPLIRAAAAFAVLGGAWSIGFASPAVSQAVHQAAARAEPLQVYLVLPASNGVSGSTATGTTEQLSTFSLSTTAPGTGASTGTGAGSASTTVSQAMATMPIDVVSTNLLRDVTSSLHLNPLEVVFRDVVNGKQETFLTYSFKNAVITNYQLQDAQSGATVQITFAYEGITLSFGTGASTSAAGASAVPTGWTVITKTTS
jgi:type VI protein secretion system component Hcp